MKEEVNVRLMVIEDIDCVLEIEEASFATPWSREAFYNELTNNKFSKYVVIELNHQIIGYCGSWLIVDEAHITNIAVFPELRGKKLGERLLLQVMEFVKALGARSLTLEVRVSNYIAQGLYRKLGFREGGIRKDYYVDNLEDALVMWVNLNE